MACFTVALLIFRVTCCADIGAFMHNKAEATKMAFL